MITINTIQTIVRLHEEIRKTAENYGYTNLRFYYDGLEDKDTLHILAQVDTSKKEQNLLSLNIEKALSTLMGVKVSLSTEGSSNAKLMKEEAEKAPLSNMEATINYFFDILIPGSAEIEPSEEEHKAVLRQWEEYKVSLKQKPYTSSFFFKSVTTERLESVTRQDVLADKLIQEHGDEISTFTYEEKERLVVEFSRRLGFAIEVRQNPFAQLD